jgi:hypothetical protein
MSTGVIAGFFAVEAMQFCYATEAGELAVVDGAAGRVMKTSDAGIGKLAGLQGATLQAGSSFKSAVAFGQDGQIQILQPNRVDGLGAEARREFELRQNQPNLVARKIAALGRIWELENRGGSDAKPADVQVKFTLGQRIDLGKLELSLSTTPPSPISGALVQIPTSSHTYEIFAYNEGTGATQDVRFDAPADSLGELQLTVMIGGYGYKFASKHPRFLGFQQTPFIDPESYVRFDLANPPALTQFIEGNFMVGGSAPAKCAFKSIADGSMLTFALEGKSLTIGGTSIDVVGQMLNELCDLAKMPELESTAHFMTLIAAVRDGTYEDAFAAKSNLKAGVAALVQQLKDAVLRLRDASELKLWDVVITATAEIAALNANLQREQLQRGVQPEAGGDALGHIVQKFAALRRGGGRADFIKRCRSEIEQRNFKRLAYVLEHGKRKHHGAA